MKRKYKFDDDEVNLIIIALIELRNSRLERKIPDLREENAVLREDVKDLKVLKKYLGSKRVDKLVSKAREVLWQRDKQFEK